MQDIYHYIQDNFAPELNKYLNKYYHAKYEEYKLIPMCAEMFQVSFNQSMRYHSRNYHSAHFNTSDQLDLLDYIIQPKLEKINILQQMMPEKWNRTTHFSDRVEKSTTQICMHACKLKHEGIGRNRTTKRLYPNIKIMVTRNIRNIYKTTTWDNIQNTNIVKKYYIILPFTLKDLYAEYLLYFTPDRIKKICDALL
jgi:hypothetical protein